jgi:glycosyltransferase involved in cell wall biosynthesis
MKTLVFEPGYSGHRLSFVRRFMPALRELGEEAVVVLPRSALASAQYTEQLAPHIRPGEIDASLGDPPRRERRLFWVHSLMELRRALVRHRPEHVYLPSASFLLGSLGLGGLLAGRCLAGVTTECLFARAPWGHPAPPARRISRELAARSLQRASPARVFFLDPVPLRALQQRGRFFAEHADLLPDPLDPVVPHSRQEARRALGLPPEGRVLGCIGYLNRRKGCDVVIRAFARSRLESGDRLLLMGQLDPDLGAIVGPELEQLERRGQVKLVGRYLQERELHQAIAAVDVVSALYRPNQLHTASMVLLAAAHRRPVLGSSSGWIGNTIRGFGLGWTCAPGDVEAVAKLIPEVLERARGHTWTDRANRLLSFHSRENFLATWMALARRRLGLPTLPVVDWHWVEAGGER